MARPRLGAPRQIRRWRHTTPTHTRRGERESYLEVLLHSSVVVSSPRSRTSCVRLGSVCARPGLRSRSVWRVRARREEDMKTLRQNGAGTPPGGQTDMNRHTPNRHASPSLALGLSLTSRTLSFNSWASSSHSKLDVASARKAATAACLATERSAPQGRASVEKGERCVAGRGGAPSDGFVEREQHLFTPGAVKRRRGQPAAFSLEQAPRRPAPRRPAAPAQRGRRRAARRTPPDTRDEVMIGCDSRLMVTIVDHPPRTHSRSPARDRRCRERRRRPGRPTQAAPRPQPRPSRSLPRRRRGEGGTLAGR